ncbi:C40 family peptidase [Actinoplanes sp. DH11]|uniref:C40 family peptidase n=1 Tax=Actinoplanes sp. DH11 TaxID=2857011 RepID=UPI001E55F2DD|nr:C40 family peptidase [Actinoplanes sp. DH11]
MERLAPVSIVADGEHMSKALRYGSPKPPRFGPLRLRPFAYSAALAAAIAALFQPIPAMAAPADPGLPSTATSIPDTGSRPTQAGNLVLPGSPASTTTTAPATSFTGVAYSPVMQQIEKGRAEITTLGDQLIRVGQERDIIKAQVTTAAQKVLDAQTALQAAQTDAVTAADAAMREAAALPPGATGSGLLDLDALARMQRGDDTGDQAAARRLEAAEIAAQLALDEQTTANAKYAELAAQWTKLNGELTKKQAAQQKFETANASELNAVETTQNAADQALGQDYLAGDEAGRSADARSIQALQFALAQRGDPYVWSEEGPDQYDCSGLMFAAYRSVGFPLTRVSRDQYYQTRGKTVSRYSLLPGDLLFFSSSNSWTGIHHVAMYAGEGMMVEAPRTGLNVRLTPVRWSRLFAATRIFGSVEGDAELPDLGAPDPDEPATTPNNPGTTTPTSPTSPGRPSPTTSPSRPTTPSTSPSKPTTPSTSPSKPTTPSTSPSKPTTPSTSPSKPTTPSTSPSKPTTPSTSPSKPAEPSTSPSKPADPPPTTPVPDTTTSKPDTDPSDVETSGSATETKTSSSATKTSASATKTSSDATGSASATADEKSPSSSSSSDK